MNNYCGEAPYLVFRYDTSTGDYIELVNRIGILDHTYKLKDSKLVVSRLRLVDFDQEETLNFDLFTYTEYDEDIYVEKERDYYENFVWHDK